MPKKAKQLVPASEFISVFSDRLSSVSMELTHYMAARRHSSAITGQGDDIVHRLTTRLPEFYV